MLVVRFRLMRYKGGVIYVLKRQHGVVASVKTMMIWKNQIFNAIQSLRNCALLYASKDVLTMTTN